MYSYNKVLQSFLLSPIGVQVDYCIIYFPHLSWCFD